MVGGRTIVRRKLLKRFAVFREGLLNKLTRHWPNPAHDYIMHSACYRMLYCNCRQVEMLLRRRLPRDNPLLHLIMLHRMKYIPAQMIVKTTSDRGCAS